jgi:hypothetical protein
MEGASKDTICRGFWRRPGVVLATEGTVREHGGANSLSFLAVAAQIAVQLGLIRPAASPALIAAVLLSVLLFPLTALTLLPGAEQRPEDLLEPAG